MKPLYGGGYLVAVYQIAIVYYAAAILLHYVLPRVHQFKTVQKGQRRKGQVLQEARDSIGAILVKAGAFWVVEQLYARGYGKLYSKAPSSPGEVAYMLATIVALDYLHDTWFYWMHRLLHWKPLYVHVHLMHHKSTVPTAFTGYAFHVVEALIVFANEVLVCFLLPIHIGLHRCYHLFTTVIHNGGHIGYELAPFIPSMEALLCLLWRGSTSRPSDALNTVRHHDMHHRFPNRNFSLYFTHWDRLMGTEAEGYQAELDAHFAPATK